MNAAEAVAETLSRLGAPHVFGLIGSGNFDVSNALVARGARFVAARHECAAVTMADAYARSTGKVGICTVHQGPGLTNSLTGLTEAAKARTPLLLLAADTAASAIRSNFRIDQDGLVASIGAVPERLYSPESAVADTVRAYTRAQVERRPVVLMMPLDIQAAPSAAPGDTLRLPPVGRPVRPSADGCHRSGRCPDRRQTPPDHRRSRCGSSRRWSGPGTDRRPTRCIARHISGRERLVRRTSLVARDFGWFCVSHRGRPYR